MTLSHKHPSHFFVPALSPRPSLSLSVEYEHLPEIPMSIAKLLRTTCATPIEEHIWMPSRPESDGGLPFLYVKRECLCLLILGMINSLRHLSPPLSLCLSLPLGVCMCVYVCWRGRVRACVCGHTCVGLRVCLGACVCACMHV